MPWPSWATNFRLLPPTDGRAPLCIIFHVQASKNCPTFHLQAKRDEEYLEEYRKQAHAALLKDPLSTTFAENPDVVHKNPRIKSVIKYNAQNPGDGSSFSSSSQVLAFKLALSRALQVAWFRTMTLQSDASLHIQLMLPH